MEASTELPARWSGPNMEVLQAMSESDELKEKPSFAPPVVLVVPVILLTVSTLYPGMEA